jgi:uncharacterized membrane protein
MEAFSDGVIAIAITLLVLDLALRPPGSPVEQFLRAWPAYLAYVVSFTTIGAAWIAHSAITERLERVDSIFLRLNLVFLLTVSFLPYPTRLVAEALNEGTSWERMATVVYGITLLVIRLMLAALGSYSKREHLRRPNADVTGGSSPWVLLGYALTIVVAFLVPVVAIALYFALAIILIVPLRTVVRELFGGSPH